MTDQNEQAPLDFGDLDEGYKKAEIPAGGSVESIPDGEYEMVIVNAFPARAKDSGNRLFKYKLKVMGPRQKGAVLWRNSVLEPDRIKWFKKDMAALGIELKSLAVLNDKDWIDENVKGSVIKAQVRNKDGYCNIYFNKKTGTVTVSEEDENGPATSSGGGSAPAGGYAADDDDVPF